MLIPDWEVEGTMEYAQRIALKDALVKHRYNVSKAVQELRIARTTVYRLIDKYGIILPKLGRENLPGVPEQPERGARQGRRPTSEKNPSFAGDSEIVFDGESYLLVKR